MSQVECPQHRQGHQRRRRCITPAGYWSIGVWFQMADTLGAQCGAQHSQVDNNGNMQRHRCPYEEPNVCGSMFICEPMSMCKYVVMHLAYVHILYVYYCDTHASVRVISGRYNRCVYDAFMCVFVLAHWYRFTCTLAAL